MVVTSAVANTEAREAIRESWARDTSKLAGVRVIFLVGLPNINVDDKLESLIKSEAEKYGDIIQVDANSRNLSNCKSLSGIFYR